MWDLWWTLWKWGRLSSKYFSFPRQYRSTHAPYSHSSKCCFFPEDTRANLRKLPYAMFFSQSGNSREKLLSLTLWRVTINSTLPPNIFPVVCFQSLAFTVFVCFSDSHRKAPFALNHWHSRCWFASPTAIEKRQMSLENCRCVTGILACNIQFMSLNVHRGLMFGWRLREAGNSIQLEASRSRKQYPAGGLSKLETVPSCRSRETGNSIQLEASRSRKQYPAGGLAKPETVSSWRLREAGNSTQLEASRSRKQYPAGGLAKPEAVSSWRPREVGNSTQLEASRSWKQYPAGGLLKPETVPSWRPLEAGNSTQLEASRSRKQYQDFIQLSLNS